VDGGEEAHAADDDHEEVDREPEVHCLHPHCQDQIAEQERERDQHHSCHYSEIAHGRLEADEVVGVFADLPALPAGVAVGRSEDVDVGVGVGSDEFEEGNAPVAVVGAELPASCAVAVRVADEQLDYVGWDPQEGVGERACHHAAPVFAHQTVEAGRFIIVVGSAPVPLDRIARGDECD